LAHNENNQETKAAYQKLLGDLFSVFNSPAEQLAPKDLIERHSKCATLEKLLSGLRAGGRRVVVYSPTLKVVRVLEKLIRGCGHPLEVVDGTLAPEARAEVLKRFNTSPEAFCLLICARATFLGEGLVHADSFVQFECDFTVTADSLQFCRMCMPARLPGGCAMLYRLVTTRTAEEAVFLLTRSPVIAARRTNDVLTLGEMFIAARHCIEEYRTTRAGPKAYLPVATVLDSADILRAVLDRSIISSPFGESAW
jgi:hypothetical protein